VFLPVNTTTVPVQFIPEDTSLYLAANTTTTAQITDQTNTTITVSNSNLTGQYGTPLRVSGAVEIGDNGTAAGIPVEMLLNGQQVGTSETQADGQVTVTGDVPAQLAAGETNLQLRVPLTDTAVAGSETTTTAEITEAQTELSLETNVSRTDAPTANLTGSLQLAGGRPIGGQDLPCLLRASRLIPSPLPPMGDIKRRSPRTISMSNHQVRPSELPSVGARRILLRATPQPLSNCKKQLVIRRVVRILLHRVGRMSFHQTTRARRCQHPDRGTAVRTSCSDNRLEPGRTAGSQRPS